MEALEVLVRGALVRGDESGIREARHDAIVAAVLREDDGDRPARGQRLPAPVGERPDGLEVRATEEGVLEERTRLVGEERQVEADDVEATPRQRREKIRREDLHLDAVAPRVLARQR